MNLITRAKRAVPKPIKKRIKQSYIYKRAYKFNSDITTLLLNSPVDLYFDFPIYISNKERIFLYKKANEIENGAIVEIGTYSGGSTYFLAMGAEASGSFVYAIDPFDDYWDRQIAENDEYSGCAHNGKPSMEDVRKILDSKDISNVELIKGFSTDVAKGWDIPVDFLWIDGNHLQVREDYEAWKKFLRLGSKIAFHDSNYPAAGYDFVTEVVDEIMGEGNWRDVKKVESIRYATLI